MHHIIDHMMMLIVHPYDCIQGEPARYSPLWKVERLVQVPLQVDSPQLFIFIITTLHNHHCHPGTVLMNSVNYSPAVTFGQHCQAYSFYHNCLAIFKSAMAS